MLQMMSAAVTPAINAAATVISAINTSATVTSAINTAATVTPAINTAATNTATDTEAAEYNRYCREKKNVATIPLDQMGQRCNRITLQKNHHYSRLTLKLSLSL